MQEIRWSVVLTWYSRSVARLPPISLICMVQLELPMPIIRWSLCLSYPYGEPPRPTSTGLYEYSPLYIAGHLGLLKGCNLKTSELIRFLAANKLTISGLGCSTANPCDTYKWTGLHIDRDADIPFVNIGALNGTIINRKGQAIPYLHGYCMHPMKLREVGMFSRRSWEALSGYINDHMVNRHLTITLSDLAIDNLFDTHVSTT